MIEVDGFGIAVVEIERKRGVVNLLAHAVGAAKGAGAFHLADDVRGRVSPVW